MEFNSADVGPEGARVNPTERAERWTPRLWMSFIAMVVLLELLASSYVMLSVALPSIGKEFATNQGVWLFTTFLLVATASSPLIGKLADTHGKRKVMLWCVGLSAAGSTVAALAPNFGMLLAGWSMAGLLSPCLFLVYSLIRDVYPPETVPMAVSISTTGMGLVIIPAPVVAGLLMTVGGWRSIFWFCAVALAAITVIIRFTTDESPVRLQSRMDPVGAVLLTAGLGALLLAVSVGSDWGWTSTSILAFLTGGAVLLGAWYISARKVEDPVIDLAVLREPTVLATTVSSGLAWALVAAFSVLVPVMAMRSDEFGLGYGLGVGFLGYAMIQVPIGLATLGGGVLVGRLVVRHVAARTLMIAGGALAGGGCLLMAAYHGSLPAVAFFGTLVGLGAGMGYAATPNLLIAAVPPQIQATAGAIASTSGNLFPAVLPVLIFSVLNGWFMGPQIDGETLYTDMGIVVAFAICGMVGVASALVALALPRRKAGTDPESAPGVSSAVPVV
ncbi:MFS transporter [Rhodococcus chondri]|uniref:MFS transporter n=1 Tax=Rhodococcus chondri TaxID=3065941 RepID=A0ABU7JPM7_9NOCA|nr:MFS transporter [Rhodococcus sp. CC-R104]MEE2031984.1 MFS transporter [Rhodococcus sp. CC-R104]